MTETSLKNDPVCTYYNLEMYELYDNKKICTYGNFIVCRGRKNKNMNS